MTVNLTIYGPGDQRGKPLVMIGPRGERGASWDLGPQPSDAAAEAAALSAAPTALVDGLTYLRTSDNRRRERAQGQWRDLLVAAAVPGAEQIAYTKPGAFTTPATPIRLDTLFDEALRPEMFGGKANYRDPGERGTDNRAAIQQCFDALLRYAPYYAQFAAVAPIRFDKGKYWCGGELDVKVAAHWQGRASGFDDFNYGTSLLFPAGSRGVTLNSLNTRAGGTEASTTSAMGTVLDGLHLKQEPGGSNPAAHGLWLRTSATIRNCVIENFTGNLCQIVAGSGWGGALEGNANGWRQEGKLVLKGPGSQHALYISGNDANSGKAEFVHVRQAGLCGVYEAGTLGNHFGVIQVDDWNGLKSANVLGGVSHGGRFYLLVDPAAGIGAATTPGTNASIWFPVKDSQPGPGFWPAWSGSGDYRVAMPMFFLGDSADSRVEHAYSEGGWSDSGRAPAIVWGETARFTRRSHKVVDPRTTLKTIASSRGFAQYAQFAPGDPGHALFGAHMINALGGDPSDQLEYGIVRSMKFDCEGDLDNVERFDGKDFVREAGAGAARTPYWRETGKNTLRRFGRSAPQPYRFHIPGFFLGQADDYSGDESRWLGFAAAPPTSGGPYAKGELLLNNNPGPGRPQSWRCMTAGSPGLWIGENVAPLQSAVVAAALTGTTSESVLATIPIAAGLLGANGSIEGHALASATSNANAKTVRLRLGGLSGAVFAQLDLASAASGCAWGRIANRNTAAAQIAANGLGASPAAAATAAINTAAAQNLVVTGQLSQAADSLTLESYCIRIFPGA